MLTADRTVFCICRTKFIEMLVFMHEKKTVIALSKVRTYLFKIPVETCHLTRIAMIAKLDIFFEEDRGPLVLSF